jgi:5,10-methylenetetrahydrofolate reductase
MTSTTPGGATPILLEHLRAPEPLVSVELRPPRADLDAAAGMGAWIDLHHALGRSARDDTFVFLTDNAVGAAEEENLAHVGANVGDEVDLRRIVPILTCKHTLEYCLLFGARAISQGFEALTVLGGDPSVGPPRCVPHGRDLREMLATRSPDLALGGWVNPHKDPATQVGYLAAQDAHADFALAQIVSHHDIPSVEGFLEALHRSGGGVPVVFGVFLYRSANAATLETLGRFFPVPAEAITRDFESGAEPEDVCARTIRELRAVGADKVYVSNLGNRNPLARLRRVLERV